MTAIKHPAGHVLQAFHDGELETSAATGVEAHCKQCEVCRAELADLELAEQLLASVPTPELPRTVWHRVQPGREQERELRFKPAFGIAACAAGIILGVLLGPIQLSTEKAGSDPAWSETVTLWYGDTTSSLLAVYQTGQE